MYCKNCGKEINDNTAVCTFCNSIQESAEYQATANAQRGINADQGGFGYGLLGCCIPVVGLVLFLVWRDEKPNSARAAGIGALVAVILSTLLWGLNFIFQLLIAVSI